MQSVLKQLDVDIEAMMAEVTGDVVAHHAGRLGRALCRRVKHASSRVKKQFTVYAQEESALLVDPSSVAVFARDVRVLRQDADRLEARVRALEVAAEGS